MTAARTAESWKAREYEGPATGRRPAARASENRPAVRHRDHPPRETVPVTGSPGGLTVTVRQGVPGPAATGCAR